MNERILKTSATSMQRLFPGHPGAAVPRLQRQRQVLTGIGQSPPVEEPGRISLLSYHALGVMKYSRWDAITICKSWPCQQAYLENDSFLRAVIHPIVRFKRVMAAFRSVCPASGGFYLHACFGFGCAGRVVGVKSGSPRRHKSMLRIVVGYK
jgi:hypothetical protein